VTFTVAVAGDIADCDGDEPVLTSTYAKTAALVGALDALVLTLGDTTYPVGAPTEFATCFNPTWGAFKDRIRPTPGNHEYYTPGAEGYFSYFGALAGPDRRGYYSFDYGSWHFISLNSNLDASPQSAQYQWLAADLASSSGTLCTIAYWHYPVFSSGMHGNIAHMAAIFGALQAAGVDIVLNGHDHIFERFAPQNADGTANPARGVREFVVGTGGAVNYSLETPRPNSEVRDNTSHGILRFTLGEGRYSWQFVPIAGDALRDTGGDVCHR
jgi:hypothetical protein